MASQPKKTPAKKASASRSNAARPSEATPVSEWLQKPGQLMELPSGKVCRAHNKGMQAFLKEGVVPNSLYPVIQKMMAGGDAPEPEALMQDPSQLNDILRLMDGVWCEVVVEPKTEKLPEDGIKEEGVLYVDMIDLEDKVFIWQWIGGGTADLERFREQRAADVESLSAR